MELAEIQNKYHVGKELAKQLSRIHFIKNEENHTNLKDDFKRLNEMKNISNEELKGAIKYLDDLPWEF